MAILLGAKCAQNLPCHSDAAGFLHYGVSKWPRANQSRNRWAARVVRAAKVAKLTPKQEKFARKYIECGNASEAYRIVYGSNATSKSVHEISSRLLVKVQSRVHELQEKHVKRHMVTVDTIAAELEEARALALVEKQTSAAVSASMGKAKIYGLLVDKQEHSGPNGGPIKTEVTSTFDKQILEKYFEQAKESK